MFVRAIRERLTFANVVSLIALFVALGGVSYAALKIPHNSVGSSQIKAKSISLSKLTSAARKSLRGQTGPAGKTGPAGSIGPLGPAGPATGPAGGALAGSYPNPTLAGGAVTPAAFGVIPSARVEQASDQPIAHNSPDTQVVNFGKTVFDTEGLTTPVAHALTAPIAGTYIVTAGADVGEIPLGTSPNFEFNNLYLRKVTNGQNDPEAFASSIVPSNNTYEDLNVSGVVHLDAGQSVTATLAAGVSLVNQPVISHGEDTFLAMAWLGP